MASLHRIVAVDRQPLVAEVTRAAVELLGREAIIVTVQTGAAALAEVRRGAVDALVCAYELPDMTGADLVRQVHHHIPDLPVILLASRTDPAVDRATVSKGPFYPLVRAAGAERFVQVLQALLDDLDPEAGPVNGMTGVALGPVPQVDVGALSNPLSAILTDVGAMAVVLLDREGRILQEMGAVGYLNRDRLSGALAPAFANMVRISPLVGGGRPQAMHFYDGDEFDIFALAVGLHHFICLVFEGSAGSRALGAVTMFGRRAVNDMLKIIGEPAFTLQRAPADAPASGRGRKAARRKPQEVKLEDVAVEPVNAYEPPTPELLEPLPEDADLESVLAGLENVDQAALDDLFDPDRLAAIAAEKSAGERLSFEEAQRQLGLLDDQG